MAEQRHVRLFRNGRNQAVRIPVEFELPGNEAILHRDGDRLVIEPVRQRGLIALLKTMKPIEESFPEIELAGERSAPHDDRCRSYGRSRSILSAANRDARPFRITAQRDSLMAPVPDRGAAGEQGDRQGESCLFKLVQEVHGSRTAAQNTLKILRDFSASSRPPFHSSNSVIHRPPGRSSPA